MTLEEIYRQIEAEMARAEAKHGPGHIGGTQLTDEQRLHYLMLEVCEVRDAVVHGAEPPHDKWTELTQVAAGAVAWLLLQDSEKTHHPASDYLQGLRDARRAVQRVMVAVPPGDTQDAVLGALGDAEEHIRRLM